MEVNIWDSSFWMLLKLNVESAEIDNFKRIQV